MTGRIGINGAVVSIPASWDEAGPRCALRLAEAAMVETRAVRALAKEKKPAANAAYMAASIAMMNALLPRWPGIRFGLELGRVLVSAQGRAEFYARIITSDENPVAWCWKGGPTVQHVPRLRVGREVLHGPGDFMAGVVFAEYLVAQDIYEQWQQTGSDVMLLRLAAVLYRPERTDVGKRSAAYAEDSREVLIPELIAERAIMLAKADRRALLLCALYWRGCMERLAGRYVFLFTGEKGKKSRPSQMIARLANSVEKSRQEEVALNGIHNVLEMLNEWADPRNKKTA